MNELNDMGLRAREAARGLATMTTESKNSALFAMARALEAATATVLEENSRDLEVGKEQGISKALMDRLTLTEARVTEMADGLRDVAALRDPVGEVVDGWRLPNGLEVQKVRVPMGVIGIIYEARPNVTADAAGLCLKSGNAVILRGSSNAINSNRILTKVLAEAAYANGVPGDAIQLVGSTDRETARAFMKMHGLVDVLIPRGGAGLIRTVVENATVPVIETGSGNCHVYVDDGADLASAVDIVDNSKTHRPGVCNAAETLLVHKAVAERFLPVVAERLFSKNVQLKGDARSCEIVPEMDEATENDWSEEYLDLVLAVRVVADLQEAIDHINRYGTGHSESIVTEDYLRAQLFLNRVDSAAVYVNASTRFTDGGQFGLGAEIGISTQKLHARGPMSLPEMTTQKYIVRGEGQIRP